MGDRKQAERVPAPTARASWGVVFLGIAIILASTAVALAIIFSRGSDSSTGGTHPRAKSAISSENETPIAATAGTIEAGRYIQAGSFKALADAETEQRRLAEIGIEARLFNSDLAQELYPGFQVLAVGPIFERSEETSTIRKLRHGGVPTAFARELTPAASNIQFGEVTGEWSGTLEEISNSHPRLNRSLDVTAWFDSSGREGRLEISSLHCRISLSAGGSSGATLSFDQEPSCLGQGTWLLRPMGQPLMVTLLPPGNDLIFLGTLSAA